MTRKVLNNKVEFSSGGQNVTVKLSDAELKDLRYYSKRDKYTDVTKMAMGRLYNFNLHAFLDYVIKGSSKANRIRAAFPYHDFENIMWVLL